MSISTPFLSLWGGREDRHQLKLRIDVEVLAFEEYLSGRIELAAELMSVPLAAKTLPTRVALEFTVNKYI